MAKQGKSGKKSNKRYRHPVPSRTELLTYIEESARPLDTDDIAGAFDLSGARARKGLLEALRKMVRAGQILENRRGEFLLLKRLNLVTGTVIGHRDGFGFVRRDEGGDDVYLSAGQMRSLFDGDRVVVKIVGNDRRGRPEGRLVEVLERGVRDVAGQFIRERGIGVVIPDNPRIAHRILVARGAAGDARAGQIVVARILDYPTHVEQATGEIVDIIGSPGDKGIATDIAIQAHGIPTDWPRDVRDSAKQFGETVPESAKQGRVDLRSVNLVTIDGADARDFDDAVFAEPSGKGFRLLVAIADVGHYVDIDSAIDRQAIRRGTSVYFPDRVVPMLPEVLSNGLCSLNPAVDRLCMVCEMRVDKDGKVSRSKFYEGVMRSAARLTYSDVNAYLTGQDVEAVPETVQQDIRQLHEVYRLFASNRRKRGAVELDIPQTRINLAKDGGVSSITAVSRNDAHRLIEECMIAANVQAAKFVRRHRIAALFRVHAKPDPDRFDELRLYLTSLGVKVPHPDHVQPRDFAKMIEQVADRPDAAAISMAMLRSMSHAEYTPQNIGHFGLALDAYAHFTSPIRRYPDLLVHRAIRHIIRGGKPAGFAYKPDRMEQLGAITVGARAASRGGDPRSRSVAQVPVHGASSSARSIPGVITGVTNFGVVRADPRTPDRRARPRDESS